MPEHRPYLVDVHALLDEMGSSVRLDADVELPSIESGERVFEPSGPAHLDGRLTSGGTGIVLSGSLSVTLQAVCSRCLREFPLDITADLEGFYVVHGGESALPAEQEYEYIEEGAVDIMAALLASVVLELPFAPVHAEECPGICPRCGADLSEGPCNCEPDLSRSPFSVLKDLFPPGSDD